MSVSITWHGHSNIQASDGSVTLLVDPFFEGNPRRTLNWDQIPKPDVVLVTHDHGDHVGQAVEICRATGAMLCCVVGTAQMLLDAGLPPERLANGIGFNIGGTVVIKGAAITMTQAFHSSDSGVPTGFIVRMPGGFTFYHAGDTGIFGSMALLGELFPLDLALLPTGGVFTMDARQAAVACGLLKARAALPIHWGTFPALAQSTDEFQRELESRAPACRFIPLRPGGTAEFS